MGLEWATLFGAFPFLLKLYADGGYHGAEFRRAVHNFIADVNVGLPGRQSKNQSINAPVISRTMAAWSSKN
jgi:hypothetical protein